MDGDYGEARGWTGDDCREFGPDPDEDRCWSCGASEDEPCTDDCLCRHCCLKDVSRRGQNSVSVSKDDAA